MNIARFSKINLSQQQRYTVLILLTLATIMVSTAAIFRIWKTKMRDFMHYL